ncbi:MAG: hypothetical protein ACRCYC_08635 [Paraclostridium sp.]|uniref:hypothetical protein n=1 Tax=Paraclostridium sp. TaxID=2023273 RepID=UPI003F375672
MVIFRKSNCINISEGSIFIKESLYISGARDIAIEKVVRNRGEINPTWTNIKTIDIGTNNL